MFFWLWTLLAIATHSGSGSPGVPAPERPARITSTTQPSAPAAPTTPGSPSRPATLETPGYTVEPQTVTGRFTTATEVKPILSATKTSWVAVREYNGQDLVYVTQILAWRCGLVALRLGVNGATPAEWPLPPCHEDTAAPNALLPADGVPFRAYPLGSVQSVSVELVYDDLTEDSSRVQRTDVLMP